jgi:hypothetical protein
MEAICSSETSVDTQRTTRRHIPEDNTLHNHRCENVKSYMKSCSLAEVTDMGNHYQTIRRHTTDDTIVQAVIGLRDLVIQERVVACFEA